MTSPILCYHQVGPEQEFGRWLNVSPDTLREHIAFFKRRGFRFLRAERLREPWVETQVCLTFDDGFTGTLTYGLEVLETEEVTASIYVVPDLVGDASRWDGEKARPLADWDLLSKAQKAGIEIGNHTADHRNLADLNREEQMATLGRAQNALESRGFASSSVCFPYGGYSSETPEALRSLDYPVGLALGKRLARAESDRLCLPRVPLSFGDRLPLMLYKVFVRPRLKSGPKAQP